MSESNRGTPEVSRRAVLGAAALTAVAVPLVASCSRKVQDAPDAGTPIAALDDLPDGGTVVVSTPSGSPVVLSRDGDSVTALLGICTHQGCSVRMEPEYILCPCHNSRFTWEGEVISGPADEPLPPLAVTVENGQVVVTE